MIAALEINADVPEEEQVKIIAADEAAAPDYTAMLINSCDLVILPAVYADAENEAAAEVLERLELLGIPAIIDRSADEQSEEAKADWLHLYAVLFGCEEKEAELRAA